ncbi:MAG: hypothetical protein GXP27_20980 [Planctomycetes bacterium]|nr:hypothetical protein [Planctomycetota bacterium]
MFTLRIDHPRRFESVRSRLGDSLIRIHNEVQQAKDQEQRIDDLFEQWQGQWKRRREQIAERLEVIERQLQPVDPSGDQTPRLAVVGVPSDAQNMAAMAAN